ncbi:hypothetical protein [Streptomyces sp. NPDC055006]
MSEQHPLPDDFRTWLSERGDDAYALAWVAEGSVPTAGIEAEVPRVGESGIARVGADLTRFALQEVTHGRQETLRRWLRLDDGVWQLAIITADPGGLREHTPGELAAGYRSWETEYQAGQLNAVQSAFWHTKAGVELYDTVDDPDQIRNLAGYPAYSEVEQRLAHALRTHMLEVHDNGFLPEGSPAQGYDASRAPGSYPLARILDVADAVPRQDFAELPRFVAALNATDTSVRRWGAIGVLALGAAAVTRTATLLRAILVTETDAFVTIPCAEALARYAADTAATEELARLAGPGHPGPVRIEALNALTQLEPDALHPYHHVVVVAAEDDDQYVRGAGGYLLFRIEGTYTPEALVFRWDKLNLPKNDLAAFNPRLAQNNAAEDDR